MDIDDLPERVLQKPEDLSPDETTGALWRLPVEPQASAMLVGGSQSLTTASYRARCHQIATNWQERDPSAWIPAELSQTTPYSSALLERLSTLSCRSRKQLRECHAKLLKFVQQRRITLGDGVVQDPWVTTEVRVSCCEKAIKERLDGLMIMDVEECMLQHNHDKTAEAERRYREIQILQAKAAQRAIDRRAEKHSKQIQLQQELWKGHTGHVKLVAIEWQDEDAAMGGTAEHNIRTRQPRGTSRRKVLPWQRHAKIVASGLQTPAAYKAKNTQVPTKLRPVTIPELASRLQEEDDNTWDTNSASDNDDDGNSFPMPNPDDLEPDYGKSRSKKQKATLNKVAESMRAESSLTKPKKMTTSHLARMKDARTEARRKKEHAIWLESVLASSVLLPRERMDFSSLGRLESAAQSQQTSSMMDALDHMDVKGRPE